MDPERARQLLALERARIEEAMAGLSRKAPEASEDEPGDEGSENLYQAEYDAGRVEDLREELAAVDRAEARDRVGRTTAELGGCRAVAQPDAARLDWDIAGDEVDQRRLAGSVGADQAEDRPGLDRERDVIDGVDTPEVAADLSELKQRGHAISTACATSAV